MIDDYCKNSPRVMWANTIRAWIYPDTKELYAKNMKHQKDVMLQNNWDTRRIDYSFNVNGFRVDDLNPADDGIMFLGCSFTFGVGLELEHTWSYRIAKSYSYKCWNLGIGAGSSDMCFRLGNYWIPKLKPKAVCFLIPDHSRIEVLTTRSNGTFGTLRLGQWNLSKEYDEEVHRTDTYRTYSMDDNNGKLNRLKNKLALQYICDQLNIPLVCKDVGSAFNFDYMRHTDDIGRDLLHPGIKTNKQIAQLFTNELHKINIR